LRKDITAQTDKHSFVVDFPPDFRIARVEKREIRQVLTNLLNNAIKYSPDGEIASAAN
jgi:signal transduction histidine kinase